MSNYTKAYILWAPATEQSPDPPVPKKPIWGVVPNIPALINPPNLGTRNPRPTKKQGVPMGHPSR
ncbi:hypothetical protein DSO57_1004426 [Entomophthora muscae]|uniref:Uncharacterized protein n=1 Tax=Entomophthora muscae TaxID=34485 RepID=A0ACC2TJ46_9FUNG|nr:hypothetical protein DSO57_1004426 [Entomophthora muscae]